MENRFWAGDRVRVSADFFWAKAATGTVATPPEEVTLVSGPWDGALTRQEKSALGVNTVYCVWFDEPQFNAGGWSVQGWFDLGERVEQSWRQEGLSILPQRVYRGFAGAIWRE